MRVISSGAVSCQSIDAIQSPSSYSTTLRLAVDSVRTAAIILPKRRPSPILPTRPPATPPCTFIQAGPRASHVRTPSDCTLSPCCKAHPVDDRAFPRSRSAVRSFLHGKRRRVCRLESHRLEITPLLAHPQLFDRRGWHCRLSPCRYVKASPPGFRDTAKPRQARRSARPGPCTKSSCGRCFPNIR